MVINVVLCSGVGGLTEGCVKRADGKYVITALAVEAEAVTSGQVPSNEPSRSADVAHESAEYEGNAECDCSAVAEEVLV